MDDELEDKIIYQTYISHMKIISKFAVGVSSVNSPLSYIWKLCRLYLFRPEVIFCGIVFFVFLIYLQAVDLWSRGLWTRICGSFGRQKANRFKLLNGLDKHQSWEEVNGQSSVFAILGRRPKMEDRFVINEDVNNTGISFFAIFDGHGGEFAADFAKDILVRNIMDKITEATEILRNLPSSDVYVKRTNNEDKVTRTVTPSNSFKGSNKPSTTDDCKTKASFVRKDQDVFTQKLNSLLPQNNNINNDNGPKVEPSTYGGQCYIENGKINFGRIINDEVLYADYKLVEEAKKTTNVAGTTVLIALIEGTRLTVANIGDSRGVMCDSKGNAIPLSFDHKPQQVRERKRIHDAGGFIALRGVWRVAGILATSRAMGDYPLKEKNLVIPDPDILTFELRDHKPSFLILASDGLWDTFSNEEAVVFIREHLREPDFGAKSLTMQSYTRGSVDNITVMIVAFKNGVYRIGRSSMQSSNSPPPTKSSSADVGQTK